MAGRTLQQRLTSGRYTLPVALLVAVACRLAVQPGTEDVLRLWAGLPVHILTAWVLIVLNNAYGLVRQRASLQSAVFLLLVSLGPDLYGLQTGHVAGLAVAGSLFFLFRAYRSLSAPADLFLSMACLGVGSLVVPRLVFFMPMYWIGAYSLQALSARSFFGSLLGWMFPFWFLLGHAWFYGEMELFTAPFLAMGRFGPLFQGLEGEQWATLGYLAALLLVSGGYMLGYGRDEKIRTRCCLQFMMGAGACFLVAMVLLPSLYVSLMPALAVCVSVLAGRLFVLTRSRAANVVFHVFLWTGLLVFLGNLYLHYHS